MAYPTFLPLLACVSALCLLVTPPAPAFVPAQAAALIQAAKAGDDKAAHAALLAGADPNAVDAGGVTALQYAGLDRGNVLTLDPSGLPMRQHLDLVKDLLEHGADPRAVKAHHFADKVVSTALYVGRYDVACLLLAQGQGKAQHNFYWLLRDGRPKGAAPDLPRRRAFDLLLRRKACPDYYSDLLFIAVRADDGAYLARSLLAAGADPNARDGEGYTELIMAVRGGRADVVTVLLKAGADPSLPCLYYTAFSEYAWNREAEDGRTPLSFAADGGTGTIFNILRRAGAKP